MKVALAKEVPEIVVATPGRLMEMLTMGATDLKRVTLVVIDEAGLQYILCNSIKRIILNLNLSIF